MKRLILFDVDRTLVAGPDSARYVSALKNLYGLDVEVTLDIQGLTERLILRALLEREGWTDDQIQAGMPGLLAELERVHKRSFQKGSMKLMPGVPELLEALRAKGVQLGLITGNVETVARRKLEAAGIWHYFGAGGGFADTPHANRADLVRVALATAGFEDEVDSVHVIGDTPRDIVAAREAGVRHTVGVSNGFKSVRELADAGAETVFEDFADTQDVLRQLGVT